MIATKEFLRGLWIFTWPALILTNGMRLFVLISRLGVGDEFHLLSLLTALARGAVFDIASLIYFVTPLVVLQLLMPRALWRRRGWRAWFTPVAGLLTFIWLILFCTEVTFYNEFHARFNFIAVDYLVYTNTVLENIFESYPMIPILSGLVLTSAAIMWAFTKRFHFLGLGTGHSIWREKARLAGIWAALLALVYFGVNENMWLASASLQQSEVAKNGVHTLFAAYLNNEIEFSRFYATLPAPEVRPAMAAVLQHDDVAATVAAAMPPGTNVIVVSMESMSARYLRPYGDNKGITPVLSRLADEGLFFRNTYATGTRTVRGLEAITLSVPPTPGQSILRRPNNEKLFSVGTAFRRAGYHTQFFYGGYSWFDNMKYFFANNGFEVLDEGNLSSQEITFSNAWGVCDEDLFHMALRQADQQFAAHQPFFQLIMTVSNHRPYTYPAGKIDIPSKTGRDGAVKYSDFAIGAMLEQAKTKPWFDKTVFVFIADHNASVAGRTEIPLEDYLIPMIFYSPGHLKPQTVTTLGSQIDFAPTLLNLVGLPKAEAFFGHDLLHATTERAYLRTYQNVAYLRDGKMAVLKPRKTIELIELGKNLQPVKTTSRVWPSDMAGLPLVREAVAIYQGASERFNSGAMKEQAVPAKE